VITFITVVFTILIFLGLIFFGVYYRRGHRVDRSRPPQYNDLIEIVWTGVPFVILMLLFFWATTVYFRAVRVPPGAMEIYVVGKQWMWKIQHPEGRWENNELHVPSGRPVVLTMTSTDVIHSFYVPAFRMKADVIPGQYTRMWFTPTKPGIYQLFCAEFCGTLHSGMIGTVTVMEPAEYERWLMGGTTEGTMAEMGKKLFVQYGCSGCHSPNSSVRAPMLEGIYGRMIPVQIPKNGTPLEKTPAETVLADQRYIHDSIVLPEKEVAGGYKPIMPTFKGRLSEEQILQLVSYIRSLGAVTAPPANTGGSRTPSAEEYKARTGFVPDNLKRIESGKTSGSTGNGGDSMGNGGGAR
jgi:cytochrome c oxidase subunit II